MTHAPAENFNPSLYAFDDETQAMVQALFRLYAVWSDPSNPQGEDVDALWEEIVGRFPWLVPEGQEP